MSACPITVLVILVVILNRQVLGYGFEQRLVVDPIGFVNVLLGSDENHICVRLRSLQVLRVNSRVILW